MVYCANTSHVIPVEREDEEPGAGSGPSACGVRPQQFIDYAYLVPYVESENEIFLKSIMPSRKATRDFLSGDK